LLVNVYEGGDSERESGRRLISASRLASQRAQTQKPKAKSTADSATAVFGSTVCLLCWPLLKRMVILTRSRILINQTLFTVALLQFSLGQLLSYTFFNSYLKLLPITTTDIRSVPDKPFSM
jgi:hypothetical protein